LPLVFYRSTAFVSISSKC